MSGPYGATSPAEADAMIHPARKGQVAALREEIRQAGRVTLWLRLTLGAVSSVCVIRTLIILPGNQLALPALPPAGMAHAAV